MSTPRGRRREDRGATLVELAIMLTLVLLCTIGVVDFGLGMRAYHSLAHAAREGARYASVRSDASYDPATLGKVTTRVRSQLVLPNEASNVQVITQWLSSNSRGSSVKVTVTYLYEPITPLLPIQNLLLSSSSQMLISE